MSTSVGGGWFIRTIGADSSYNAFCYAGNGCSIIDLYDSSPLTVQPLGQVEQDAVNIGDASGNCATSRVDDRTPVSDDRTLCASGATPGSVRLCRLSVDTNQVLLCGETSILALATEDGQPTQNQLEIEHSGLSNRLQLISPKPPGAVHTDGNCVVIGFTIFCDPGMTWLFAFPGSFDWCEGGMDDLLAFRCPDNGRGFTFTGCCSDVEEFTRLPTGTPTTSPSRLPSFVEPARTISEAPSTPSSSSLKPTQATSSSTTAVLGSSALSLTIVGMAVAFTAIFVCV